MGLFGHAPTFLVLAFFASQTIVGALTIVQPVATLPPALRDWVAPLVGVRVSPPTVDASVRQIVDGKFQRAVEAWVGDHLVQRPTIVRAFNELQWLGFGTSHMADRRLMRAPNGALYEQSYMLAYCGIDDGTNLAGVPAFARRLRAAQDWFKARGRPLVYLMAPVKTTWLRGPVPASLPCPVEKQDTLRPFFRAALDRAGVDWVDGPAALEAWRGRVSFELFPRNGIHRNQLGAVIGANALLQKLRDLGVHPLPTLSYRVVAQNDETGYDRDLANLLNLLWPPPGPPAPRVEVTPAEPPGTLRLAAVNDSFFQYIPIALFEQGRVFRSETVFGYMNTDQFHFENGRLEVINQNTAEITRTLLDADVVVLEEVESRIGGKYALWFLDIVEAEMSRGNERAVER